MTQPSCIFLVSCHATSKKLIGKLITAEVKYKAMKLWQGWVKTRFGAVKTCYKHEHKIYTDVKRLFKQPCGIYCTTINTVPPNNLFYSGQTTHEKKQLWSTSPVGGILWTQFSDALCNKLLTAGTMYFEILVKLKPSLARMPHNLVTFSSTPLLAFPLQRRRRHDMIL